MIEFFITGNTLIILSRFSASIIPSVVFNGWFAESTNKTFQDAFVRQLPQQ
jgi:hypothetical protein